MTDEQIKYSLENRELKLNKWDKFSHYGIVGFCLFIPLLFLFFHLKDYLEGIPKPFKTEELWFLIIPILIGIAFYLLQKNRLKFKEVNTTLNRVELNEIIEKVANEVGMDFEFKKTKGYCS